MNKSKNNNYVKIYEINSFPIKNIKYHIYFNNYICKYLNIISDRFNPNKDSIYGLS